MVCMFKLLIINNIKNLMRIHVPDVGLIQVGAGLVVIVIATANTGLGYWDYFERIGQS